MDVMLSGATHASQCECSAMSISTPISETLRLSAQGDNYRRIFRNL